ncbi:hypothetical protein EVAR_32672_1 [Eumeta japonica]|uniref:Alpha-2-macroglobulin bait region domain-containing protein n=1 Tax=Eumeta variegata TaxID=151549 RepID=A0A4C1VQ16_EUMVA|nr:hypothetical protein EVAR_32672_1 [Eumeta japonica]
MVKDTNLVHNNGILALVTVTCSLIDGGGAPRPPPARRGSDSFPVTADMAPVSSLLVYYVTAEGEPVSDVASFHVRLLHKELKEYLKGQRLEDDEAVVAAAQEFQALRNANSDCQLPSAPRLQRGHLPEIPTVAVAVEERRWWYPRASLRLRILAPRDAAVCLIGARAPPDAKFDPHAKLVYRFTVSFT